MYFVIELVYFLIKISKYSIGSVVCRIQCCDRVTNIGLLQTLNSNDLVFYQEETPRKWAISKLVNNIQYINNTGDIFCGFMFTYLKSHL